MTDSYQNKGPSIEWNDLPDSLSKYVDNLASGIIARKSSSGTKRSRQNLNNNINNNNNNNNSVSLPSPDEIPNSDEITSQLMSSFNNLISKNSSLPNNQLEAHTSKLAAVLPSLSSYNQYVTCKVLELTLTDKGKAASLLVELMKKDPSIVTWALPLKRVLGSVL